MSRGLGDVYKRQLSDGLWHGVINSVIWWIVAAAIIGLAGAKRLTRETPS